MKSLCSYVLDNKHKGTGKLDRILEGDKGFGVLDGQEECYNLHEKAKGHEQSSKQATMQCCTCPTRFQDFLTRPVYEDYISVSITFSNNRHIKP